MNNLLSVNANIGFSKNLFLAINIISIIIIDSSYLVVRGATQGGGGGGSAAFEEQCFSDVGIIYKYNINSIMNRGVTIHDATIRYVSRYKPQDTVYDTIRKTRHRLQQLRHLNKALAPKNKKGQTEYTKTVLIILYLF